jgi:hypothetical protein
MNELLLPESDDALTEQLRKLHKARRTEQARRKLEEKEQERRRQLSPNERKQVFDKTYGHCHLCGGNMRMLKRGWGFR